VFFVHEIVALCASVFTFYVNFTVTRLASTTFFAEFHADGLVGGCTSITSKGKGREAKGKRGEGRGEEGGEGKERRGHRHCVYMRYNFAAITLIWYAKL